MSQSTEQVMQEVMVDEKNEEGIGMGNGEGKQGRKHQASGELRHSEAQRA